MNYLLGILLALLLWALGTVYYYVYIESLAPKAVFTKETLGGIFTFNTPKIIILVAALGLGLAFGMMYQTGEPLEIILANQVMLGILATAALIDYKVKRIPNQLVLVLMGVGVVSILIQVVQDPYTWRNAVYPALIGLAVGGGILLLAHIVSRKSGVGAGDVKLFGAIGFVLGFTSLLGALFYCFLFSALAGVWMLLFKKAKLKDSMAMAPFAFFGVLVTILMTAGGF